MTETQMYKLMYNSLQIQLNGALYKHLIKVSPNTAKYTDYMYYNDIILAAVKEITEVINLNLCLTNFKALMTKNQLNKLIYNSVLIERYAILYKQLLTENPENDKFEKLTEYSNILETAAKEIIEIINSNN